MGFKIFGRRRNYKEVIDYLLENRSYVMQTARSIFDVYSPDPNIVIGLPSVVKPPQSEIQDAIQGIYNEFYRFILINPIAIVDHMRGIDPKFQILRVLAKEYGHHLHSALHDWKIMPKLLGYCGGDLDSVDSRIKYMQGLSVIEAVGIATMLKIANKLEHPDRLRHLRYLISETKDARELLSLVSSEDTTKVGAGALGLIYGARLSRLNDDDFRTFVRRYPEEIFGERISLKM